MGTKLCAVLGDTESKISESFNLSFYRLANLEIKSPISDNLSDAMRLLQCQVKGNLQF